jgi:flavin-dependent dehydrogenase
VQQHPLVTIGAGPTGLAAAAHAHDRGLRAVVVEAGARAGASVSAWGHVRLFSPWSELVDPVTEKLLTAGGWVSPDPAAYPNGTDWVAGYLRPLAGALAGSGLVEVRYGHRVTGVARRGRDVMVDTGRDVEPFVVHLDTAEGSRQLLASAVIDASGTWTTPTRSAPTATRPRASPSTPSASCTACPTSPIRRCAPGTRAGTSRWPAPAPQRRTCSSPSPVWRGTSRQRG